MTILLESFSKEEFKKMIQESISEYFAKTHYQPEPSQKSVEYVSRTETAKKLRISLPTLADYTKKGKIKGYNLGRKIMYKSNEIDDALKAIETIKYGR